MAFRSRIPFFLVFCLLSSTAQAQMMTGYSASAKPMPPPRIAKAENPVAIPPPAAQAPQVSQAEPERAGKFSPIFSIHNPVDTNAFGMMEAGTFDKSAPVDLQADTIQHDEQSGMVTASGNVFLTQSGRILRADQISYNIDKDIVIASGHVVLNEENGDIHYSEEVELYGNLKSGVIKHLQSQLADGSRFTAQNGKREGGNNTTMYDASYTPCEPCVNHPESPPAWQIVADEVSHDKEDQSIAYKNARFEVEGVPILYTPYFSHSDGTVERKSGFLTPVVGFKSELGAFAGPRYYWDISPDKDATLGILPMTEENPLAFGQFRKRWDEAEMEINGSITHSGRKRLENGEDISIEDETRGHMTGHALWNMNEKWRSGVNAEWASDDQFMRQYNIQELETSNEDVLENEIYAERFDNRNYAVGRLLAFQDVRIQERQAEQPEVLPEAIASFKGEPGAVPIIKGNWEVDTSFLGLRREGNDQDMNRFSAEGAWKRRLISDYGMLTDVRASMRADAYNTRDRDVASVPNSDQGSSTSETRLFPKIHAKSSYPVARPFNKFQAVIEPIAAVTLAPNVDVNNDIPNEDSQDVQIDFSNIFESNRFPGLDRIEDKSRATYGILTGVYGYEGSQADVFLGQSRRLNDDDNPFPEGSGLSDQNSDIVGRVSAVYKGDHGLDYRFQLENENFTAERHEIDAYARFGPFFLSSRYLYATELGGTDIRNIREQIRGDISYTFNKEWLLRVGATQDLGDQPGLRRAYTGLEYNAQCYSLSVIGQRNLTEDSSGESPTELMLRIGLKNLGEFTASGLQISDSGSDDDEEAEDEAE